jgi:hypothetical protein
MGRVRSTSIDVTIVDGASLFDATETIAERTGRSRVTVDYTNLKQRLDVERRQVGWRPASETRIMLSVDPNSEGQQRFKAMLTHSGFQPHEVNFREAFVSLPPGRSPSESTTKSLVSLSSRIAYIAGLMAHQSDPHFLVVSHCFELYSPLQNLAKRVKDNGGRVGLAYFRRLLDFRWEDAGLLDGKLEIKFIDLDKFGRELLGIDLDPQTSQADGGEDFPY